MLPWALNTDFFYIMIFFSSKIIQNSTPLILSFPDECFTTFSSHYADKRREKIFHVADLKNKYHIQLFAPTHIFQCTFIFIQNQDFRFELFYVNLANL